MMATEVAVQLSRQWSGPMPHPDILRQYEEVVPGAAERILHMAEVAAMGDHEIDSKMADAEIASAARSLWAAVLLALAAGGSAFWFFAHDEDVAGVAFLSLPVALIIQAILSIARERRADARREMVPPPKQPPENDEGPAVP